MYYSRQKQEKFLDEELSAISQKYINTIKNKYNNIDYLFALTKCLYNDYKEFLKNNKHTKVELVPNMLYEIPKCNSKLDKKNIITISRLDYGKKNDDIIKSFSKIKESNWKLYIIGDGKEFNNLKEIDKYYDEKTNTYVFKEDDEYIDLVVFNFDLDVRADIWTLDIIARNIKANILDPNDPSSVGLNPFIFDDPVQTAIAISTVLKGLYDSNHTDMELAYRENAANQAVENLSRLLKEMYPRLNGGNIPNLEDMLKMLTNFDLVEKMCEIMRQDQELAEKYSSQITYFKKNFYANSAGREATSKYIYLDEANYLGNDAGDIIVFDNNHKIISEANESGEVNKILIYDKNDGELNTVVLYENGERKLDKVLIPETFNMEVSEIDVKKIAYEFLKLEREEI